MYASISASINDNGYDNINQNLAGSHKMFQARNYLSQIHEVFRMTDNSNFLEIDGLIIKIDKETILKTVHSHC